MRQMIGTPRVPGYYWMWDGENKRWVLVEVWDADGAYYVNIAGVDYLFTERDLQKKIFMGPIAIPTKPPDKAELV